MVKAKERKIDIAWRKICERTHLLQDIEQSGYFCITAKDVDRYSDGEQPRLLAKMDSSNDRPDIFKENGLSILPLNRGEYVIFKDSANVSYKTLPANDRQPTSFSSKYPLQNLDTLTKGISKTESDAIDTVFLSTLLEEFCKTTDLRLTKRGRFGSSEFFLKLPNCGQALAVKGSQLEVDAIYESTDTVVLIESKAGFPPDFIIRQLSYPYTWLKSRTTKRIVPIFLGYANDEYQLSEFAIGDQFGDIELVQHGCFVLDQYVLARADIDVLIRNSPSAFENTVVPFPQANSLDRVVEIIDLASRGYSDKTELAEIFGFDPRQSDYYVSAAKYLGFLTGEGMPSDSGALLLSQPHRLNRTELLLKSLLKSVVFRKAILILRDRNYHLEGVSKEDLLGAIRASRPELDVGTCKRRAGTVKTWLKWLMANCDFKPTK